MNKLAFLPLLLLVGSMGAYAQIPESYYNQTKLYDNQKSSSQITISVDKFSYSIQDTINAAGNIANYKQGSKIDLNLLDPSKKTIEPLSISADQTGYFSVIINFPTGLSSGKYSLAVYYPTTGATSSISFNVIGSETPTSITIPYGSSIQFNKLNFSPIIFKVQAGIPITWTNNDDAVHNVASGYVGVQNRIFADGKFDSSVIGPGQTYTLTLFAPGNYTYFDKSYPWLVGTLKVVPYSGPASQKPTPPSSTSSVIGAGNYVSVATERLALESHQATLFNDNMTIAFKISKTSKSDNFTISNDKDAKLGLNSLKIVAALKNGTALLSRDYTVNKLQDWSHYNYLNFWFRGQNTKQTFQVVILNETMKAGGTFTVKDDSSNWKKVQIPLYSVYKKMDFTHVRDLEFLFNKGTKATFKLDGIQLVSEGQKTIFNENMASVFSTSKQTGNTITIFNDNDSKIGANSLGIKVATTSGLASVFHDYTVKNLQDWSNYNYLNFWFKGQDTKQIFQVDIKNATMKVGGYYTVTDDSSDWKKVQIPLSVYKNTDLTKVRNLEFLFSKGTQATFEIDDVTLSIKTVEPALQTSGSNYISGQTIFVIGNIQVPELGAAATVQVINPGNNIVSVNQATPKSDNTFGFSLPLIGSQFVQAGTYKISAQYGLMAHKANTSFTILNPQLAETYKGFGIYSVSDTFYAIPQTQGSFDINRIEAGQYSIVLTNDTSDNIKKSIDEIVPTVKVPTPPVKVPTPVVNVTIPKPIPFPVSDNILLAIWQNRTDLQSAYPEVAQGNLTGLKEWAKTIGWNQDPRLAALIPKGEIPGYLIQNATQTTQPPQPNLIPTLQVVSIGIAIGIGGAFGYKVYRSRKKLPSGTL